MPLRRLVQNPTRILKPYITKGMRVLELGAGPGFFTFDIARLTGITGKVIAADMQQAMLDIIRAKTNGTPLGNNIVLHRCAPDTIGVIETVDFALLFYMLHEVPDPKHMLRELYDILAQGGRVLIVEPIFHVSKDDFSRSLEYTTAAGFTILARPKLFLNRAALIGKPKSR